MDIQTGGYGDQDKDNDQPAEAAPLPNDLESPTFTPPSTGPFSVNRQKTQAFRRSVGQAKINAETAKNRKVGGPPESKRIR